MPLSEVGQRRRRLEGIDQVTGQTKYAGDVQLPNMLHVKGLHSKYPHAKLLNIDTSRAAKVTGVEAIITGKDFPDNHYGPMYQDQPLLAEGKVRHLGELVAAVAARSEDAAEEALELIKVDYEELPVVIDPREAMKPDSPKVHESGNLVPFYLVDKPEPLEAGEEYGWWQRRQIRWGNVEEGFKKADRIYEHTFSTQMMEHVPLEPHVATAAVDGSGKLTIWTCSQMVFWHARDVTRCLGIPFSKARLICPISGGGFGSKNETTIEPHVGLLAMLTRKPVRWAWTTEEEFLTSSVRHPYVMTHKTGVMKDGTIVAKQLTEICDTGAYLIYGCWQMDKHCILGRGPYSIPNVRVDGYVVYTNKQPGGAVRGFGVAQATFACESQMDIIAEDLGIDPMEIRLKNALRQGDSTVTGQKLNAVAMVPVLEKATELSAWQKKDWEAWKKEVGR